MPDTQSYEEMLVFTPKPLEPLIAGGATRTFQYIKNLRVVG